VFVLWERRKTRADGSPLVALGLFGQRAFVAGLGVNLALLAGLASGLSNTALQIGIALGVAIASTVAVSRSDDYLAANEGANPLVALTEGFQSAFMACVVLAGIGLALALLLPGCPRRDPRAQLEAALAQAAD
jgi:hypothetical protein